MISTTPVSFRGFAQLPNNTTKHTPKEVDEMTLDNIDYAIKTGKVKQEKGFSSTIKIGDQSVGYNATQGREGLFISGVDKETGHLVHLDLLADNVDPNLKNKLKAVADKVYQILCAPEAVLDLIIGLNNPSGPPSK